MSYLPPANRADRHCEIGVARRLLVAIMACHDGMSQNLAPSFWGKGEGGSSLRKELVKYLSPQLRKIDRGILACARFLFRGNGLIGFMLAGMVLTVAFTVLPVPYGGIVHAAERLIPPVVERIFVAYSNHFQNVIAVEGWEKAMEYDWILQVPVIAGIWLHAILIYLEIRDRCEGKHPARVNLKKRKKHPILWRAVAVTGAILIVSPVLTELGILTA